MSAMAATAKKLDVHLGDVVEIEGRRYDIVADGDGGVALEPMITKSIAEIHAEHGERELSLDEFQDRFGEVAGDGEG